MKQLMKESQQLRLRASVFYLKSKKRDYEKESTSGNRAEKSLMCYLIRQMIEDFDLARYDAAIKYKSLDIDFFIDFAEGISRRNFSLAPLHNDADKASAAMAAQNIGSCGQNN